MTSVILAIARSLKTESPKHGRCHIILLSPVFDVLHAVSGTFPDLHVHQINPAILPFIPNERHREIVCHETCCQNVFVSNWTHHQSVPRCIKQIIHQARSETPLGHITDLHVDLRPKSGCEVLKIEGPTSKYRDWLFPCSTCTKHSVLWLCDEGIRAYFKLPVTGEISNILCVLQ